MVQKEEYINRNPVTNAVKLCSILSGISHYVMFVVDGMR